MIFRICVTLCTWIKTLLLWILHNIWCFNKKTWKIFQKPGIEICECKRGGNNNKVTWNKQSCTCGSWPFKNFCTYTFVCSLQNWCLNTFQKILLINISRYLPSFSQPFWSMNNMQMNHDTLGFFCKKISFGMFYVAATSNGRGGKPLWRGVSKNPFHIHSTVSSLLTILESMGKAVDQLPLLSTQASLILYWSVPVSPSCQGYLGHMCCIPWAFGSVFVGATLFREKNYPLSARPLT